MTIQSRISKVSADLITSLDSDARYVLLKPDSAFICSQVSDEIISSITDGSGQLWRFDDIKKAIRSIRRLNENVQIYVSPVE